MSDEEVHKNSCSPDELQRKKPARKAALQSDKDASLLAFDLIYQNSDKIRLPNSSWACHKNHNHNNIIVFSKARWFSADACLPPLYERQVLFNQSNQLKIYINNIFSPLEAPPPRDIAEMEQILANVEKQSLCLAGPIIEFTPLALLAQKDYALGRWRHKCCPIIVQGDETTCNFCSSINKVFRYPKFNRLPFGKRSRAHSQQVKHFDRP